MSETIFALASGRVAAGVAVIRLSGAAVPAAVRALAGGLPAPRRASLRRLRWQGAVLDQALVLWFPGPASYTGEDAAELHIHGGRAVIAAVTGALVGLGLRPAEAGEFTRRAVLNDRLGLLEAEAVGDLVAAETEAQRRQALRQMEGALGALYQDWRTRLIHLLAHLEAAIDFPDEDLGEGVEGAVRTGAQGLLAEIRSHLADRSGERLREGFEIAILGAPNVGKSSLLNALARADCAIVSDRPGTTRDVIEVVLDLGGYRVVLLDTAGLRESDDPVELEGIRRARDRGAAADLRLVVVAAGDRVPAAGADELVVVNKIDRAGATQVPPGAVAVSAVTGAGMAHLARLLAAAVGARLAPPEQPALTRARHRHGMAAAAAAVARALAPGLALDLMAEELRLAARAVGQVVGAVDVEDLLDVVFRDFCIGK